LPLKLLLQLSARNLFRHKRRNFMLLLAICVAVAGVVLTNALIRGMQFDMREAAVANLTGHIKVLAPGYLDDPNIEKSFELARDWQPDIPAQEMEGWAARIRIPAVIMSERETRGVQFVGVDPAQEHISFLGDVAIEGEGLTDAEDRRVLIGVELARQLETQVGRRLVLITQGLDGRNREAGFRIVGLYDAEGTALEKQFVFTGVAALQRMVEADVVTEVSIKLIDDGLSGAGREFSIKGLRVRGQRHLHLVSGDHGRAHLRAHQHADHRGDGAHSGIRHAAGGRHEARLRHHAGGVRIHPHHGRRGGDRCGGGLAADHPVAG
jgi:ABC-type lipoprotein release transport system permease subunit